MRKTIQMVVSIAAGQMRSSRIGRISRMNLLGSITVPFQNLTE